MLFSYFIWLKQLWSSNAADRSRTEEGFEAHIGTNYLGPFLLTMLLLPNLRQTAKKVVGFTDPNKCFVYADSLIQKV